MYWYIFLANKYSLLRNEVMKHILAFFLQFDTLNFIIDEPKLFSEKIQTKTEKST